MGTLTVKGKNAALNGIESGYVSLHSGDPGENGANEISGGLPVYTRKASVFATATDGVSRQLVADVYLDVPAGTTVRYVGYWDAASNGNFLAYDQVADEAYTEQGQYKVLASSTEITF